MLIKSIYILKIHMKKHTNFRLKNVKMLEQNICMIENFLLNIQTIWLIFTKTLKIIIQIKNVKYYFFMI